MSTPWHSRFCRKSCHPSAFPPSPGRHGWRSLQKSSVPTKSRRRLLQGVFCALLAVASGAALGGCTYSGGEMLYFLGLGRGEKVEAKFQLADGPIMILIDDAAQRVDWPMATRHLFDDLAQELLKNQAAGKIIPLETVDHLRQSILDFQKRGCREIGELGGADQVLWISVRGFSAEEQVEDITVAAYFSVTLKVINVHEKLNRSRVRLWPSSPRGYAVTANMTGSEVGLAKTKDAIAKELAGRLAVETAKVFYDHRLGVFEREQ